ncbi:MAG TPA: winged helix-turn-helix domain-containing protein [Pseudolabrys sp.]|nr:winged helix-turn-helix domain-containing protein [Pseudolabrys sp.]
MRYRFENFLLDTGKRELRRFDRLRPLEPQVFDLLEYLVASRDRVVTRDDIFSVIWPDRIVSDGALSTRVNAARHAVDDNGIAQRLIRTIRTKGFRFVGDVEEVDHAAASKNIDDRRTPIHFERPSIAVLPLIDLSGESTQTNLADALTEEIITSFAKSDWLSVSARNSSFEYKNKIVEARRISRRLGVRYLLEGSVRQSKGQARLIIRLIDGVIGNQIWSERYNDKTVGLLDRGIDDTIAAAVVHQVYLASRLCAEGEMAKNPDSWEFVVRILSMMNSRLRSQVETARKQLEAAFKHDARSVTICSLFSFAITLGVQQGWQRQRDAIPVALRAAEAALALNPEEPWAHLALGYALIWHEPEEALLPIERALKLNPKLAMGHYLLALALARAGSPQGISERAELGRTLSAFDLLAYGHQGVYDNVRASACLITGQYSDGIEFAKRAIAESPLLIPAHRQLVANCALAGRRAEAKNALAKLKCMSPSISLDWIRQELKWSRAAVQRNYVEAFRSAGLS